MKIKRRDSEFADIDVGAFSDIAFLLIIFFILTTTFVKPFGRKMEIPAGENQKDEEQEKQLTINLRGKLILYGEDAKKLTQKELRKKLEARQFAKKSEKQRMVIVESAADVPFEHYFQVVTAISQTGGILALVQEPEGKK